MKRYISLIAGILVQIALGGIYAFSSYVPSFQSHWGYNSTQTQAVFGLTILMFTLYMIISGRQLVRRGPRTLIFISGILFLAGHWAASYTGGNYPLFLAAYLLGIAPALSFGYVCPLAAGLLWFPNHRGLVTGLSVAGYGIGGVVLSSLVEKLLGLGWDIETILRFVGAVWGGIILLCGAVSSTPPGLIHKEEESAGPPPIGDHKKEFAGLTMFLVFGTLPGLMLIGALKPFGLFNGIEGHTAALGVSFLSLGNGLGRIIWGISADRVHPRRLALVNLIGVFLSVLILLAVGAHTALYIPAGFLLGFTYGGPLVITPDQVSRVFGGPHLSRVYPVAFSFHGIAAAVGASLAGFIFQFTGSYHEVFMIAGGGALFGLAGYWFFLKDTEKLD
ncbi:MAG: MFS transporter [Spirochaetales bacterium]|nr:MFS transporter [Spirochaetales bacterium]